MNAIINLCHFCEIHGPRIVYCTQPLRPQEPKYLSECEDDETRRVKSPSVSSVSSDFSNISQSGIPSLPSMKNDICEGCYSVKKGFVSHDEGGQVSYVSTQHPYNPQVFSRIRQACIRSLSCEVCPGREGPIFFGDEQYGHVLSYTFYIKDSKARGLRRYYSILVVMMDKIYLLNSWPFLVPNLQVVINNLQSKAENVHDGEVSKRPPSDRVFTPSLNPGNLLHHRSSTKPARSLIELTNDKHVFELLHLAFVWILKSCGNRITESILEGPPTEDSIIDMEKIEETEEGFIKVFKKEEEEDIETFESVTETDNNDLDQTDSGVPLIRNIRHLCQILGIHNFHILCYHVVIGNQVIVTGVQKALVKSVLSALTILLPKGCCRVINYSDSYQESWKCNFLGLSPDVSLPIHVMASEKFVLLEVIQNDQLDGSQFDSMDSDLDDNFKTYEFKMSSPVILNEKAPTVLTKMESSIQNKNLSDSVLEQCFICMKEEWMNKVKVVKVKVVFKFTKAGGNRSKEDTEKLLQVMGAKGEEQLCLIEEHWSDGH
ncbi:folliculin [Patella vulgata]|uniref:folliculin n=1 Tax=Patella vulgata TaxID=6465 RepID=UPI0024A7C589|nr:folliculin [Patella vulgata]